MRLFRFIAICCAFFASGCGISTQLAEQSILVGIDQIKVGSSDKDSVDRLLGEPTDRSYVKRGEEQWRYTYTQRKMSLDAKTDVQEIEILFRNNMVAQCWMKVAPSSQDKSVGSIPQTQRECGKSG